VGMVVSVCWARGPRAGFRRGGAAGLVVLVAGAVGAVALVAVAMVAVALVAAERLVVAVVLVAGELAAAVLVAAGGLWCRLNDSRAPLLFGVGGVSAGRRGLDAGSRWSGPAGWAVLVVVGGLWRRLSDSEVPLLRVRRAMARKAPVIMVPRPAFPVLCPPACFALSRPARSPRLTSRRWLAWREWARWVALRVRERL
jgi:hypothetical protein